MTATVPTSVAADMLGVHPRTILKWTRKGHIVAAAPGSGSTEARYAIGELRRWWAECTASHGPECRLHAEPFHPGVECACVACHCGALSDPSGWMGTCSRCHRPIVRAGRVWRPSLGGGSHPHSGLPSPAGDDGATSPGVASPPPTPLAHGRSLEADGFCVSPAVGDHPNERATAPVCSGPVA